jgi:hypothetical protein
MLKETFQGFALPLSILQGYLAHKKPPPPGTVHEDLWGWAFSYERGTPAADQSGAPGLCPDVPHTQHTSFRKVRQPLKLVL